MQIFLDFIVYMMKKEIVYYVSCEWNKAALIKKRKQIPFHDAASPTRVL